MDGHKHEGLSDEALEREIEAALGVDPSPEFLPRVRTRIASEQMREGWLVSGSWQWVSVLAGAIVVVASALWFMRGPAVTVEIARNETAPVVERPPARPPVVSAAPEQASPGVTRVERRERSPQRQAAASQEVVISPDDAAALRQLVAAITARQVEARDIPELGMESAPLPPLGEIVVEPINISPLAALEGE